MISIQVKTFETLFECHLMRHYIIIYNMAHLQHVLLQTISILALQNLLVNSKTVAAARLWQSSAESSCCVEIISNADCTGNLYMVLKNLKI